jgi:hypothetical protein
MNEAQNILDRLAEYGINTRGMNNARAMLEQPILPEGWTTYHGQQRAEIAELLGTGKITADEAAQRMAPIASALSPEFGQMAGAALNIRRNHAFNMLVGDRRAISKALRTRIKATEKAITDESATLAKAGALRAAEAMQMGRDVAGAWGEREAARELLRALYTLRTELTRVGIVKAEDEAEDQAENVGALAG